MTGPVDPDATRPLNDGDATMPAGPRVGGAAERAVVGPPSGGPPSGGPSGGSFDEDDEGRRSWWWIAAGALVLGIAVGVIVALLASGGDDKKNDGTTTTSSSTTTSSTTTTTLPAVTTTAVPQPPGQVNNLVASTGAGSGEVNLDWDAVPGAAQYRIYRSMTQGITGSLVATVSTNSYVDVPGVHAYYQVSAVSSGGLEGQRSVEMCGAPVGDSC